MDDVCVSVCSCARVCVCTSTCVCRCMYVIFWSTRTRTTHTVWVSECEWMSVCRHCLCGYDHRIPHHNAKYRTRNRPKSHSASAGGRWDRMKTNIVLSHKIHRIDIVFKAFRNATLKTYARLCMCVLYILLHIFFFRFVIRPDAFWIGVRVCMCVFMLCVWVTHTIDMYTKQHNIICIRSHSTLQTCCMRE